jgi:hypothetical protein
MIAVMASLAVVLSGGAQPAQALVPPITFSASIGDCYVFGTAQVSSHWRIDVLDHRGVRKARANVVADTAGHWSTGCFPGVHIQAGDHIEGYQNGLLQRLWVLPGFKVVVDRVNDRAVGEGPANDHVLLYVQKCFPGGVTCETQLKQTIATNANGTFNVALVYPGITPWDAIGDQGVQLQWQGTGGDELFLRDSVPFVTATVGSAVVSGQGLQGAHQTMTLRSAGGAVRATASATGSFSDGSWTARLKHNGSAVKVKLGDTIRGSFASDASFNARVINAAVDLGAHTLSGTCFPHALAGVRIASYSSSYTALAWGTTGANGELGALNTSNLQFVASGWTLDLYCGTSKGDVLHRRQIVP